MTTSRPLDIGQAGDAKLDSLLDLKLETHVTRNTFRDVYKGSLRGRCVAVQIFRAASTEKTILNFTREARQLSHPNLLPILGPYYIEQMPCLVSPWMEHGNIGTFLANHPCNTKLRISFILDVAMGLDYLGYAYGVHGDLRTANILVTPSLQACIADVGISSIISSIHSTPSCARRDTVRYQAPELLRGGHSTLKSDIYSFACVAYEILLLKLPFEELCSDSAVITAVVRGARPTLDDNNDAVVKALRDLIQSCWEEKAEMRPTAHQIVERLLDHVRNKATTTQSTIDWNESCFSIFRHTSELVLPTVSDVERMIFGEEQIIVPAPEQMKSEISYTTLFYHLYISLLLGIPERYSQEAPQEETCIGDRTRRNTLQHWVSEWTYIGGIALAICGLLVGVLAISSAGNDPIVHTLALLSLLCLFAGSAYAATLVMTFGRLENEADRRGWIDAARAMPKSSFWTPWILLAMPLAWTIWGMFFLVLLMGAFIWRDGATNEPDATSRLSPHQAYGIKVVESMIFAFGLGCFGLMVKTVRWIGLKRTMIPDPEQMPLVTLEC
ncbi:Protein kinase domain-containing protein [Mycena sanguinolenta]|uniref:Protein kinase domain-containing protein n=1 Tax=Mycena sanguinolenta TaxID=230812 RepID=A0A8H6Z043_9AGAR|nr:Protein kinase domain-containing protein [Mycena sanguinolenta]